MSSGGRTELLGRCGPRERRDRYVIKIEGCKGLAACLGFGIWNSRILSFLIDFEIWLVLSWFVHRGDSLSSGPESERSQCQTTFGQHGCKFI